MKCLLDLRRNTLSVLTVILCNHMISEILDTVNIKVMYVLYVMSYNVACS
jgi:hypothetical protein